MNNTEKIIKAAGIVLAIFIIISIVSLILSVISGIFFSFNRDYVLESYKVENKIDNIKVEIGMSLTIKEGEEFKVETNNRYVRINEKDGNLVIDEVSHFDLFHSSHSIVTIYVPKNIDFNDVKIETGAGAVVINSMKAKSFNLVVGAGSTLLEDLDITKNAKIETGAGKLVVSNVKINNLDLEIGTGHAEVVAVLNGESEIQVGVGSLVLELTDKFDDYSFNVEKGIGDIQIDGKSVRNNSTYGEGAKKVHISNGVGSVMVVSSNES